MELVVVNVIELLLDSNRVLGGLRQNLQRIIDCGNAMIKKGKVILC